MNTQERMDWILERTVKLTGLKTSEVSYILFGGGCEDDLDTLVESWGYDDNEDYAGNKEFWKKLFITEEELNFLIESA